MRLRIWKGDAAMKSSGGSEAGRRMKSPFDTEDVSKINEDEDT